MRTLIIACLGLALGGCSSDSGLLVLANRAEIDVYREALERAAEMLRNQRR